MALFDPFERTTIGLVTWHPAMDENPRPPPPDAPRLAYPDYDFSMYDEE